jgi:tetratricopeptide (TPR) repeat protein
VSDIHLTAEIVAALRRGDLDQGTFSTILYDHLRALCPTCRAELGRPQPAEREPGSPEAAIPPAVLRLGALGHSAEEIERARRAAVTDLAFLEKLPRERQRERVARAWKRFRGVLFAELLLARARRCLPQDALGALHYASLAERAAEWGQGADETALVALAHRANATRILGNRREAGRLFGHARHRIRVQGITDLATFAEVDWLEGVLAKDLRRLDEADKLLSRSLILYSILGDSLGSVRPMLSLCDLEVHRGRHETAAGLAEEALDLLEGRDEPRLRLMARFNLARARAESGGHAEAREALRDLAPLLAEFPDPWTLLRARWLEGTVAAGVGEDPAAEAAFRDVRAGFIREGLGYDTALVSLDLAAVLLGASRWSEAKELAGEMTRLFAAEDMDREAVAALLLFQEAVRQETATVEGVRELRVYLADFGKRLRPVERLR